MKTSLSGTLNKWDISLSGTLFSVRKPKMNLTKWDTMILERSLVNLSLTFHSLLVQIIMHSAFCRAKKDYKEENKEEKIEERAEPEDPDDDVPLARLVTALQPHLAESMMTHEFIDEDADLPCQDLSDWEKQFFAEIGDKPNENNGNESKKMRKKKEKQRNKQRKK